MDSKFNSHNNMLVPCPIHDDNDWTGSTLNIVNNYFNTITFNQYVYKHKVFLP